MPVVTAARLEGNVYNATANVSQITLTDEILAVRVRFAFRPFAAQGIPLAVEPGTEFINQFPFGNKNEFSFLSLNRNFFPVFNHNTLLSYQSESALQRIDL